ncbi:O-sialoglycoprotein endopeptidase [Thermohalobacter berrensis]|uniref:N(6)-L-threonylcarbamoyladenine synthase n=1 Tax=Thermohalobacter berrensis TaxID=99594 RepID=A0A419TAU0_9FIRM|nr:O-sialoglycoprotein endopeptidase [Thermohalobacter berrensis]RKD34567.1 hypothetical protein BET03_01705 [Thermohalobacter berrensis]
MDNYYIGFDTSAYTTSIAVINDKREIIADLRKNLKVKKGNRGLRQQEAVFQHTLNIPELIDELTRIIDLNKVKAVAASVKPRNLEGSYMPVFRVGQGQAYILSKVLKVAYKEFSHQEGHIASGILKSKINSIDRFLALHISGGTTELLLVENEERNLKIEIIGGTKDISAGQLIDRIGVDLNYPFPSGKYLDEISKNGKLIDAKLPISVYDTWINFSGPETYFKKLIKSQKYSSENLAKSLFYVVGYSLKKILKNALVKYDIKNVLIIGGVASNSYIRYMLKNKVEKNKIGHIYFPDSRYCTDNAVGIAYLSMIK